MYRLKSKVHKKKPGFKKIIFYFLFTFAKKRHALHANSIIIKNNNKE